MGSCDGVVEDVSVSALAWLGDADVLYLTLTKWRVRSGREERVEASGEGLRERERRYQWQPSPVLFLVTEQD
jgi:hypothetical protein